MSLTLDDIVDTKKHPIADAEFREQCRTTLGRDGALNMAAFLRPQAVEAVRREGEEDEHRAYFCTQQHNVYLMEQDPDFDTNHPRNRTVESSKGCITDDIISPDSPLRGLYDSPEFRQFLCAVLDEQALYNYADPLSSINLHYARQGQELGWHFDNSSFAITLLIQSPDAGGEFEYLENMRDAARGEMNFDGVAKMLDGELTPRTINIEPGTLLLFRGRNAIHRVTPTLGTRTRMLVVLAYNAEPGVCLSESARMTFYGRLG